MQISVILQGRSWLLPGLGKSLHLFITHTQQSRGYARPYHTLDLGCLISFVLDAHCTRLINADG